MGYHVTTRYIAQAIRRNCDGKPDYIWVAKTSDGNMRTFQTEEKALTVAQRACGIFDDALYAPTAFPVVMLDRV